MRVFEKYVNDIHEEAVIYGGFLRDLLVGTKPNDIDIAVQSNWDIRRFLLTELGAKACTHPDMESYKHSLLSGVTTLNDSRQINSFSMQVTAQTMVDYCDIGICRIAWSKRTGLVVSEEFLRDVTNKTLTVYRADWGQEGVKLHLAKLRNKFPDYRVVMHNEPNREDHHDL